MVTETVSSATIVEIYSVLTIQASKDRGDTTMNRAPITHDISLESQLRLQNPVLSFAVLAGIGVINAVVRAHNRSTSGTKGLSKRPCIDFVNGLVIDVGGDGFGSLALCISAWVAVGLLLIRDVMLDAGQ